MKEVRKGPGRERDERFRDVKEAHRADGAEAVSERDEGGGLREEHEKTWGKSKQDQSVFVLERAHERTARTDRIGT